METDKPIKRGGPRPNSGRRPIDPALKRKQFSCTLAPDAEEWVRGIWDKGSEGQSLGDVMDLIIRTHPSFGIGRVAQARFRDKYWTFLPWRNPNSSLYVGPAGPKA